MKQIIFALSGVLVAIAINTSTYADNAGLPPPGAQRPTAKACREAGKAQNLKGKELSKYVANCMAGR